MNITVTGYPLSGLQGTPFATQWAKIQIVQGVAPTPTAPVPVPVVVPVPTPVVTVPVPIPSAPIPVPVPVRVPVVAPVSRTCTMPKVNIRIRNR